MRRLITLAVVLLAIPNAFGQLNQDFSSADRVKAEILRGFSKNYCKLSTEWFASKPTGYFVHFEGGKGRADGRVIWALGKAMDLWGGGTISMEYQGRRVSGVHMLEVELYEGGIKGKCVMRKRYRSKHKQLPYEWQAYRLATNANCTKVDTIVFKVTRFTGTKHSRMVFDDFRTVRANVLTPKSKPILVARVPVATEIKAAPQLVHPVKLFSSNTLSIYAQCPTRKVFSYQKLDALPGLQTADILRIAGARNESEQVVLALAPSKEMNNITLTFGPMTGPGGVLEGVWSWRRILEVKVEKKSKWYGLIGAETGMIPDPLTPSAPFNAPAGINSTLLLDCRIPPMVKAGKYTGRIKVVSGDKQVATIPVELIVWDITLPAQPTLDTYAAAPQLKKDYAELIRLGITSIKYGGWDFKCKYDRETGKMVVSPEAYAKSLHTVIEEMGFRSITTPGSLLGRVNWLAKSYLSSGIPVGDERFYPIMEQYMKQLGDFYRANGWQNKVRWRIMDEINAEHHAVLTKICQHAKRVFPEVQVMVTTGAMPDELAEVVDIWVAPWHFFATKPVDIYRWRQLQQGGQTLYAYMNSLYTLNASWSLGAMRIFGPTLAKYGYKGALWWGYNYYGNTGQDPWKEGIATMLRKKQNKRHYANGYLFYPPRKNDPHYRSSMRWENYRQGLEDAELMLMLGKHIDVVCKSLGVSSLAKSTQEIFSGKEAVHNWGALLSSGFRLQTYRPDSTYIHRFRQLLAHEIINMPRAPLALIDLEPDGGWTTSDSLHIRGLVAAGTRVEVDGEMAGQFKKDKPFIFVVDRPLKHGQNKITIRLTGPDGQGKVLYREVERK